MNITLPDLEPFKLSGSPFLVVDPSSLDDVITMALDRFMIGKTCSHPVYIYVQDWDEFCAAVERDDITI
ncbi:hypothetical protein AB4184_22680 [Vibrio splendidus]